MNFIPSSRNFVLFLLPGFYMKVDTISYILYFGKLQLCCRPLGNLVRYHIEKSSTGSF